LTSMTFTLGLLMCMFISCFAVIGIVAVDCWRPSFLCGPSFFQPSGLARALSRALCVGGSPSRKAVEALLMCDLSAASLSLFLHRESLALMWFAGFPPLLSQVHNLLPGFPSRIENFFFRRQFFSVITVGGIPVKIFAISLMGSLYACLQVYAVWV